MDALVARARAEEPAGQGPGGELLGFLPTIAPVIVAPIHPKAISVILTTQNEFELVAN